MILLVLVLVLVLIAIIYCRLNVKESTKIVACEIHLVLRYVLY